MFATRIWSDFWVIVPKVLIGNTVFPFHTLESLVRYEAFVMLCFVSFWLLRMLVYEYVDSGNLERWLHGDIEPSSPLTWEIRMNIVLGTAKG